MGLSHSLEVIQMVQPMRPSTEQSVKEHFAKVFQCEDWSLFREVAEINLCEAAHLRKLAFPDVPRRRRLLIRNIRKRLLIGIGVELLLKAVYLKSGKGINKPLNKEAGLQLPFALEQVQVDQLDPNETYTLAQLIDCLPKVVNLQAKASVLNGLKVAKVFRNKEGHVVSQSHDYVAAEYRSIEQALVELYRDVFSETLTVRFSFTVGERGAWKIASRRAHRQEKST